MTTRDDRIRRAIEAASNALVDAHYWEEGHSLPGAEVLAEITIMAAADVLCPPDHLHYTIEFEAEQSDGEQRYQIEHLEDAARAMLQRYLDLANSGDAGFWNPEKEPEVIALRSALNDGKVITTDSGPNTEVPCN